MVANSLSRFICAESRTLFCVQAALGNNWSLPEQAGAIFLSIVVYRTDKEHHPGAQFRMETNAIPRVVVADRIDGGVYIEFSDGQSGLYSSSLLLEFLPQAEKIVNLVETEE